MLIALLVFAFLLGSIPFGVIICRAKGVDIFSVGSGNIGATNVVRAVGPVLGGLVLLLDVSKGLIPGLVAHFTMNEGPFGLQAQAWSFVLGCVAIFGHMFSPWIKFKGGKGIATGLGAMLSSIPLTGLAAFIVFTIVTSTSRFVSLGSIIAAISAIPLSIFLTHDSPQVLPILILFNFVVIYKHRSNITRILNGTESKFRFRKNDDPEPTIEEPNNPEPESKIKERNDDEKRH